MSDGVGFYWREIFLVYIEYWVVCRVFFDYVELELLREVFSIFLDKIK